MNKHMLVLRTRSKSRRQHAEDQRQGSQSHQMEQLMTGFLSSVSLWLSSVPLRSVFAFLLLTATANAQNHIPAKVDIPWDRYYTYPQLVEHTNNIANAYPDICKVVTVGKSLQGRDIILAIVNNPATGEHTSKPAMWIDGNVHGNEIQAGEVVVYSLWYLTKAFGNNEQLTKLLDNYAFYFLPSQNPDGREYWFSGPNTPNSSRSNQRPVDDDQDGLFDEDPPDDIDADGSITSMWRRDPNGQWIRSTTDPRVFIRLPDGQRPLPTYTGETWSNAGSEGIDNDNDGQINEDGPGGDDMNRNWPSDWQPPYVQGGAGLFPFSNPEPRAVGTFILDHPNIAGVQSYHNAGGMILRGPGANYRDAMYPGDDRSSYDEIARIGEQMLPYYRSMVIYRDLYTVHGGFVNWTAEGLGIFSFTNEMWNDNKYFYREGGDPEERNRIWRDQLNFGQVFKDYAEFDHPRYGKVLIGGPNKWASRVTPTWMLEEELHRNFAFTMFHADHMPLLRFGRTEVAQMSQGVWSITFEVWNDKLIPSRSGIARNNRIGSADILFCRPSNEPFNHDASSPAVITSGTLSSWIDKQIDPVQHEPGRVQNHQGINGRTYRIFRFIVKGNAGDSFTIRYESQKAKTIETTVQLK
jgi:hypothetical protein